MKLKSENLALFFTSGMSLKSWRDVGMLEREIELYIQLAKYFNKIYFITYGNNENKNFKKYLPDNIIILDKNSKIVNFIYQFIIPLKFNKILKKCSILKTNQIYGSIPAIISKVFFPNNKLVIRSGYIASLNAKLYHTSFLSRVYINIIEWLAYRFCNIAVIPTKENAERLIEKYKFLKSKLKIVNNSINTKVFTQVKTKKLFDIGYVGRLNKDKNLTNLLLAVIGLNLSLCFIGQGEEKEYLISFAKKWKINLKIIDKINNYDLPKYYNQFKIFVFPSLHEGNPKTLLEAMACGLPVIGCNVIGVNNIINDGFNGILSNTDKNSLRNKIKLLNNNNNLRQQISSEAKKFVLREYSLDEMLNKEIEIYETLT